ncbi:MULTISPECIES: bifunctional phosphatase PAP2/diacylglycerol kinase family protein [Streptomyces]|uniref:Phosphatase PAP2 family protein n=1 Tax=Streptomyces lycii TaxID=2654337 RepID=A0ABQ7FFS8_9ACTN|nr:MULTISPECIES: bifunctional phosphatase PAP2/diacylglycerol kinase family protein [Streptomyces]KAF4406519.1 phosphatase PAP2 family protein [Streptomyces lycii]PGH47817.1 phosphoesterase [Streptomyces sp. Ru87]
MDQEQGHPVRRWLGAADRAAFARVANRHWPGAERALPRLSHSANHGLLWFAAAAGMWAVGDPRTRRAAVRGVMSLALASATVNTVGKRAVRRKRPLLDGVPVIRQLKRQPVTTSFPSGHSASAAAFAVGAALESRRWGAALAPVAASVAFSRIYTGAHYPSDVLAGASLGAGAAFAVRGMLPSRSQLPPPARPRADAPALPDGEGLYVVVNPASGAQPQVADPLRQLRTALPKAEVVLYEREAGPLALVLEEAARDASGRGGALGVFGGDGTVGAAAAVALRYGVPLAVLPGGTFNHFAQDLGVETVQDACAAVASGSAVRVDVGRLTPADTPGALREPVYFLNTFSLGSYPDLVRLRERWSSRIGGPVATLLGAVHVLRTSRPVTAVVNGRRRSFWLLFAGNGAYRSVGVAPVRRYDLADGLLDVRVARGGRFARTRLVAAALTGALRHSPVYTATRPRRLRVSGLPTGTHMAYDGEVTPAPPAFELDKVEEALVVYRPVPG